MPRLLTFLLVLLALFPEAAAAQSMPLVRIIASHLVMSANDQGTYRLQCPTGYVPTAYSMSPQYPYDYNQELSRDLIDSNRATINRVSLAAPAPLMGGGYAITIENEEHHQHDLEIKAVCLATSVAADNVLTLAKAAVNVPKLSSGSVTALCPADYPVALGGFSNADGRVFMVDGGTSPVWGTSASPVALADMVDGQAGPPTGWQAKVVNNSFFNAGDIVVFVVCGKNSSLQTFVYSAAVPQGAFGVRTPFSVFAPVPDGWTAVGTGFDGGLYAEYWWTNLWVEDGVVVDMLQWYPASRGYDSSAAEVRAFMVRAGGNSPRLDAGRAVVAVLAVPKPATAPTTVTVVEFYHAAFDHYFITAIPKEIADLDTGVRTGWARTGQTFKAYGAGSSGRTGRRPVCRAYGLPEAGLDSHFYSASPDECAATIINGLGYAWGLEASEVFQMDLPDATTGNCPAGGIPVYRVFNQRKDANHRYTTSIAIRDEMVSRGGVAEGYGPASVALCALP